MALPTSRAEFRRYCLRNLGAPVIKINVEDDQIEDRIDEALQFWYDYHYDGSERTYYKYALTEQDFTNKYITLPENIIGAVRIFDLTGAATGIASPFNIQYQIAMSELYTLSSQSLIPFYMSYSHLQLMQQILVGQQPVRYNRHTNKLWLDMEWQRLLVGHFVIVEAFSVIDPETYVDAWKDRVLMKYGTALIKRQWGNQLKKYDNMEMTNGIKFNGQKIYDEAVEEIKEIEQEMRDSALPACDMIG